MADLSTEGQEATFYIRPYSLDWRRLDESSMD